MNRFLRCRFISLFSFMFLILSAAGPFSGEALPLFQENPGSQAGTPGHLNLSRLRHPLYFTPNRGQTDDEAAAYAKTASYTLWLTKEAMIFDTMAADSSHKTQPIGKSPLPFKDEPRREYVRDINRIRFLGTEGNGTVTLEEETRHRVNIFTGQDPQKWKTDIPTFAQARYANLYPQTDLKIYGSTGGIEYDWIIKPGGDPGAIRFQYQNVQETALKDNGDLKVETRLGPLTHKKPVSYQMVDGKRKYVAATFAALGENTYGFEVGDYDPGLELVIDPVVLTYSTYLGGGAEDYAYGIDLDSFDRAVICGKTASTNFPTSEAYQETNAGGNFDAFVTRFSSGGNTLSFSTYLGGSGEDVAYALKVDDNDNTFITGVTDSTDFPTLNPPYGTNQGGDDMFITKLDSTGGALGYSGYYGGSSTDRGYGIDAVDGYAYVTGYTNSDDFYTYNAYQSTYGEGGDAFVVKFTPAGSTLSYSTYLGGSSSESGQDIDVYGGKAYVVGSTLSTDYPTHNAYQSTHKNNGYFDAYLTCLSTAGTTLEFSTFIGGDYNDYGSGVAVSSAGNVYITGNTESTDWPTLNAYQGTDPGGSDAYVTKFNPAGDTLSYSTYLGGSSTDSGLDIAVKNIKSLERAYVTGYTSASNFPTKGPYQYDQTSEDAFVTCLNHGGSTLRYSTYLGGGGTERGYGIAVSGGYVYVSGRTDSTNFPTANPCQAANAGGTYDAFVTKLSYQQQDDDLVGTWSGQGVYYRNTDTLAWSYLASEATSICTGDLDNDGLDDLVGIWPAQGGVWTRHSDDGSWRVLSSTADWIACGDMNGDGWDDLLGTWAGQGTYYRDSAASTWTMMATAATHVTCGYVDSDSSADLIGIWPGQGGVWIKFSTTGNWMNLASTADWIACGDMNGDGRDDLVGSWSGQGVFYKDTDTGDWFQMATPATQIATGDMDADETADLIGIWPAQSGVWVKYSGDASWELLGSTADWITTGKMRASVNLTGKYDILHLLSKNRAGGPFRTGKTADLSCFGPKGDLFSCRTQENLSPTIQDSASIPAKPGPGQPGFTFQQAKNLIPGTKLSVRRTAPNRKRK